MKYKSDGRDKWDSYIVPKDQFISEDYYICKEKQNFHCNDLSISERSELLQKEVYTCASVNMKEYKVAGSGILIDRSNTRFGKN